MTKEELVAFIFSELDEEIDEIVNTNRRNAWNKFESGINASNDNFVVYLTDTFKKDETFLYLSISFRKKQNCLESELCQRTLLELENGELKNNDKLLQIINNFKQFKKVF